MNQIGLSYLMMGKSVLKLCSCGWDTSKARGRRDIWRDGGGTLAARRQSERDHERSRCFARMISNRQMKIVRVRNMGDVAKQAVEFGPDRPGPEFLLARGGTKKRGP